jgi:DNA-binding transcriptional MerR regulator
MIMHSQDSLKAGAVAKAAGVGVQTLHYYERLGLLQKPNRSAANYRLYAPEAVRRVRFIKKAQALGLTLEETKQILDLKDHGREPCRKVAELGEKHLQETAASFAVTDQYHAHPFRLDHYVVLEIRPQGYTKVTRSPLDSQTLLQQPRQALPVGRVLRLLLGVVLIVYKLRSKRGV